MTAPGFRERLAGRDGGLFDGDVRYLLLRADTLAGLFERLGPAARAEALAAFADAVAEYGGRSIARYAEAGGSRGELLALMAATAPALGWGRWEFDDRRSDCLVLQVQASPFTGLGDGSGPSCAPIAGMLRALASRWLGPDCLSLETACRAQGAGHCEFRATAAHG